MDYKKIFILLVVLVFTVSCGSKKATVPEKTEIPPKIGSTEEEKKENLPEQRFTDGVQQYINLYAAIAQEEMRQFKIPASITLAQGILESGAGKGELSRRANNHFGIKCHDWNGDKVYHDDDRNQECFRKYQDPKYSYRDHSLFLTERRRYAALFELDIEDYEGWAKGLRAAGYATDRMYPVKLINLIERYGLYSYDAEVLGKKFSRAPAPPIVNRSGRIHFVQKGDTLYSLARRYNTTVEDLKKNNKLQGTEISIGQELSVDPE